MYKNLDELKEDYLLKIFELYSPFGQTMNKQMGTKLLDLHPNQNLRRSYIANQSDQNSLDQKDGFFNSYENLLKEVKEQKENLENRLLYRFLGYGLLILCVFVWYNPCLFTDVRDFLTQASAAGLYLTSYLLDAPLLSQKFIQLLFVLLLISTINSAIHLGFSFSGTWGETNDWIDDGDSKKWRKFESVMQIILIAVRVDLILQRSWFLTSFAKCIANLLRVLSEEKKLILLLITLSLKRRPKRITLI